MKRKYGGHLACAAIAAGICAVVVLYERSYADWGLTHMVCDGCFVAGVLFTGLGALAWVAGLGGFTALGYGWYLLLRRFSFSDTKFEERMSYLEYVQQKKEKHKKSSPLLATGLACIATAGVLLYFC